MVCNVSLDLGSGRWPCFIRACQLLNRSTSQQSLLLCGINNGCGIYTFLVITYMHKSGRTHKKRRLCLDWGSSWHKWLKRVEPGSHGPGFVACSLHTQDTWHCSIQCVEPGSHGWRFVACSLRIHDTLHCRIKLVKPGWPWFWLNYTYFLLLTNPSSEAACLFQWCHFKKLRLYIVNEI